MLKCKACQSSRIKTRTNYSHGKKSRSITNAACKDCGSIDIESTQKPRRWNKK